MTGSSAGVTVQGMGGLGKSVLAAAVVHDADCTLKLWSLLQGTLIASFTCDSPLICCAIAPDGKTVVAGDRTGKVHFFSIEP